MKKMLSLSFIFMVFISCMVVQKRYPPNIQLPDPPPPDTTPPDPPNYDPIFLDSMKEKEIFQNGFKRADITPDGKSIVFLGIVIVYTFIEAVSETKGIYSNSSPNFSFMGIEYDNTNSLMYNSENKSTVFEEVPQPISVTST